MDGIPLSYNHIMHKSLLINVRNKNYKEKNNLFDLYSKQKFPKSTYKIYIFLMEDIKYVRPINPAFRLVPFSFYFFSLPARSDIINLKTILKQVHDTKMPNTTQSQPWV